MPWFLDSDLLKIPPVATKVTGIVPLLPDRANY
jgi:hypothetical protein